MRILIIDDDERLGEMLSDYFRGQGFTPEHRLDGESGLTAVEHGRFDAVVLDVMMGSIDEGFQVAYQLRSDAATREIPIIMLTAVGEQTGFRFDPDKDEDFLPVDEFLEKPVSPRKLVDLVRKHLPTSI